MRSKRVAQTCDVIPGHCSAGLGGAGHHLAVPTTFTLRVCVDVGGERSGVLVWVPVSVAGSVR
jgi:hypothetical protein